MGINLQRSGKQTYSDKPDLSASTELGLTGLGMGQGFWGLRVWDWARQYFSDVDFRGLESRSWLHDIFNPPFRRSHHQNQASPRRHCCQARQWTRDLNLHGDGELWTLKWSYHYLKGGWSGESTCVFLIVSVVYPSWRLFDRGLVYSLWFTWIVCLYSSSGKCPVTY